MQTKQSFYYTITLFLLLSLNFTALSQSAKYQRKVTSLNGNWELAQTNTFDHLPQNFDHSIPVPGLIDMAKTDFETRDDQHLVGKVYWHKRNFKLEDIYTGLIQLKIHKAKYHTKVYLNGQLVGDNLYSFTPSYFDIKKYLNAPNEKNELVIGVGSMNMLPDTVVRGRDFEKTKYIPGIYDEVEIIQSGYPFISNVQIAPNIETSSIRVQNQLSFDKKRAQSGELHYVIRELSSGNEVNRGKQNYTGEIADFEIGIPNGHLWSPEDPFLYTLELRTAADKRITRFGLRSFEFKEGKPYGFLNKNPYYLRGTNVNIYRFFEDPERGSLPWNDEWVIKLIKSYKNMNWNSARFCIGFPPERWYEIADSLGFMIQDEYPIWWGGESEYTVNSKYLVEEYKSWMKERWNHPSVVIWDAQNESITEETGKAIQKVRSLDLSNRPWDNGWAPPQADTDPIEAHPYLFVRYMRGATPSSEGPLKDLLDGNKIPRNNPNERMPALDGTYYDNPIVIDEYGWLWLNRDGSTTTLTDRVYETIVEGSLTTRQRRELYAHYLGMLTEYWRAHRTSAAVLHFCGLGYSRPYEPRGQTSDHFIDVENLEYDPWFIKYVKPAFAAVGLMIDYWDKKSNPGSVETIPVHIVNDTPDKFTKALYLEVKNNDRVIKSESLNVQVESNEKSIYLFKIKLPEAEGNYELVAYYKSENGKVFSARQFDIIKP